MYKKENPAKLRTREGLAPQVIKDLPNPRRNSPEIAAGDAQPNAVQDVNSSLDSTTIPNLEAVKARQKATWESGGSTIHSQGTTHMRLSMGLTIDLCSNSDRPLSTARRPFLLIHLKPASAAMNAPFAQHASKSCCSTRALTVREALFRELFGLRLIGGAIIISGMTRRAARSGIARSIRPSVRCVPPPSELLRLNGDSYSFTPTLHL